MSDIYEELSDSFKNMVREYIIDEYVKMVLSV